MVFRHQLQYRFEMVLLVWRLYYSDDILIIDIQTDLIPHLPLKKLRETNISIIYRIFRFPIQDHRISKEYLIKLGQ